VDEHLIWDVIEKHVPSLGRQVQEILETMPLD